MEGTEKKISLNMVIQLSNKTQNNEQEGISIYHIIIHDRRQRTWSRNISHQAS